METTLVAGLYKGCRATVVDDDDNDDGKYCMVNKVLKAMFPTRAIVCL